MSPPTAVSFLVLFAAVALLNASGAHCKHYFSRKEGAPSTNVVYGRACNATGPFTDRDYIVVSNFPNPESNEELLVAARSRVRFTEVFENLYTATGFGNSTLEDMTQNVPVDLLAMFDPETCVLSGSGYSFDVRVNDVFRLHIGSPERFSGPYASLINETVVFTRFGRFDFIAE